jgi:Tol biopolymer transport system component
LLKIPAEGKKYLVCVDVDSIFNNGVISHLIGRTENSMMVDFSFFVPEGRYYLYAFIDRDDSGISGGPDDNDLFGIYNSNFSWPNFPNVVVPEIDSIQYDIFLYQYSEFNKNYTYKIAFISNQDDEDFDLYVMSADGMNLKRLTEKACLKHSRNYDFPSWSPDGQKITFSSNKTGNHEIYTIYSDGYGLCRLTYNSNIDFFPRWSPVGDKIVYISQAEGNRDIYVMDCEGLDKKRITDNEDYDYLCGWSPDGSQILFSSPNDGQYDLFIVDPDNMIKKALTYSSDDEVLASYSPQGDKIAFIKDSDLYVMDNDGMNPHLLTNNFRTYYTYPEWSPGGYRIVFCIGPSVAEMGDIRTYIIDSDGSNLMELDLARSWSWYIYPQWSPDGRKIVFSSDRDGYSKIYTINPDGTNLQCLTTNTATNIYPSWSPVRLPY